MYDYLLLLQRLNIKMEPLNNTYTRIYIYVLTFINN